MKLRVWHIPQVPMKEFYVDVSSIEEAWKILNILWDYDNFQYENNVKPDYCNVSGLQYYDEEEKEWLDWEDDDGCDIKEHFDNLEDWPMRILSQNGILEGNRWQMNLPCKVGDTIYVIDASEPREYLEIEPCFIASIAIFENGKVVFYSDTYNEYDICDLDSLVNGGLYHGVYRAFLAKEEAEEELKKMKGEG